MGASPHANTATISLGEVKNTCFVIMPFGLAMDRVYEKVFKPAIERAALSPIRGDEIFGHRRIMADIWDAIRCCRCVLAELTGKNANVLYELGLSHAIGKPVIIVTSDLNDVPFDLRDLRCIIYDKNHPDWGTHLKSNIENTLLSVLDSHDPAELLRHIHVSATFPPRSAERAAAGQRPRPDISVAGEWEMSEVYPGGRTAGVLELRQTGSEIEGSIVITTYPTDEDEFIIKESVSGFVKGREVVLSGTSFQMIAGDAGDYQLDKWIGTIEDPGRITGRSVDAQGLSGTFNLRRR